MTARTACIASQPLLPASWPRSLLCISLKHARTRAFSTAPFMDVFMMFAIASGVLYKAVGCEFGSALLYASPLLIFSKSALGFEREPYPLEMHHCEKEVVVSSSSCPCDFCWCLSVCGRP